MARPLSPGTSRVRMGTVVRLLRTLALLTPAVVACTTPLRVDPPGPGVPRVTEVWLDRDRVVAGCPVTMTVAFEDTDRDVTRVIVYLSLQKAKRACRVSRFPWCGRPTLRLPRGGARHRFSSNPKCTRDIGTECR